MKPWLWLAALFAAPVLAADLFEHPRTPAQVQTTLRAAMPDLGQGQVLRGRFKQRKFLSEIPNPLLSSGEFLMVRGQGLWWHTQTPLDSALTLTPNNLSQRDKQPGMRIAATLFLALFTLDLDTLAQSFDLFAMQSGPRWTLGLRPRDAALAAWFRQATLSGSKQVQRVTLSEASGDRSEIELQAAAQSLSSLTAAERQRFAP